MEAGRCELGRRTARDLREEPRVITAEWVGDKGQDSLDAGSAGLRKTAFVTSASVWFVRPRVDSQYENSVHNG